MRKLTKLSILAAITILVLAASPAAASSPPLDVGFVLDQIWEDPPEGPIYGTFTASGPAVDAGLMCSEGIVFNLGGHATPENYKEENTFHLLKVFICSDANPEVDWFIIRLNGQEDFVTGTYNWNVWKASGIFAKLHGTGKATVDFDGRYIFVDTLTGQLHID